MNSVSSLLALVQAVCSAASVIAILLTIREMRWHRISTYLPDLFFTDATVHLAWLFRSQVPIRLGSRPISDADASDMHEGQSPPINCLNLGAGPAKRIEGRWIFNVEAFGEAIGASDNEQWIHAIDPEIRIRTRLGRQFRAPVVIEAPSQIALPFVTTYAGSNVDPVAVQLPVRYLQLAAALAAVVGDGEFWREVELPDFSLELSFEDRTGKRHMRAYGFAGKLSCPTASLSHDAGIGASASIRFVGVAKSAAT